MHRQDALFKFIELASEAEKRFRRELGYSFGLNKKAARQSLFNVEINARILVTNKVYQADLDDKQAFRDATQKVLKVEDYLYRDISLALDNGSSLDEICYRIKIAKIKEASVSLRAKMAIDGKAPDTSVTGPALCRARPRPFNRDVAGSTTHARGSGLAMKRKALS